MSGNLIILIGAACLVAGYFLLRAWQRKKARKLADDPWTKGEHR